MSKVKTAISIDDSLLEETDHIAQELDIPRSQVVSLALLDFNQRYRNKQLLAQINAAYEDTPDSDEMGTLEIIRSHRKKLGENDPQTAGGDPQTAGGDPQTAGGDPQTAGGDPRTSGGDPRTSGGDPRTSGGKKWK